MGYYYSSATGKTYSSYQMRTLFGINTTTTSVANLNAKGFYPVQDSSPDFDLAIYSATFTWAFIPVTGGQGAIRVYSPVPKPLPDAKVGATREAKAQAGAEAEAVCSECGLVIEILTAVASQDPIDRPARFQADLDLLVAVSDSLANKLNLIDAATTVDELNNILNPPTGIISLYRTGDNLQQASFQEFSSLTLTESDTELYVPGTTTTISYSGSSFPATPSAFAPGNYLIQLRQVANGLVIAEFEVTEIDTEYSF